MVNIITKPPKVFEDLFIISKRLNVFVNMVDLSNMIIDDIIGCLRHDIDLSADILNDGIDYELLYYLHSEVIEALTDLEKIDEETIVLLNNITVNLYEYFLKMFKEYRAVYTVRALTQSYIHLRRVVW